MRPITLSLIKIKIKKKRVLIGLILILILTLAFGGGYFLSKKVSLSKLSLAELMAAFKKEKPKVVEQKPPEVKEEKKEVLPQPKFYEKTAESGEGITHLARKALKEYLKEKGESLNLTPEHKVYIEDYLQKKTGDYWLKFGEKISFSENLIKEAIEKAQNLTQEQLKNLEQFAKLVPEFYR